MSQNRLWKYDPEQAMEFDPRFRKATTLMRILVGGIEKTVTNKEASAEVEVFLGSLHGEIEPTFNYLKGLAQTGSGRPFLFQNSLHHSTTGFLSQQFQFLGATYSLCVIKKAQEEIMAAALMQGLINQKPLLMIHAETFPGELTEISGFKVKTEGASLFINKETVRALEIVTEVQDLKTVESFEDLLFQLEKKEDFKLEFNQTEIGFRVN